MSATPEDQLLGRIALHYKLVDQEQLNRALNLQVRQGKRLGEVLLAQNIISDEQLKWLLSAQDQYLAKQKGGASPSAPTAPTGPSAPAASAPGARPQPSAPRPAATGGKSAKLEAILKKAFDAHASDVHIHALAPIQMRVGGTLRELKTGNLDAAEAEALIFSVLTDEQAKILREKRDLDVSLQMPFGRLRASFFKQQRGWDAVFRPISPEPPTLAQLGLPESLKRLIDFHQGLVLLTGPAGSGKSSTMAALVNMINESRSEHIITVEDPIEYLHTPKKCLVNQRQTGKHTESFANALRGALREDPDVVVIGELRDLETISLSISAAETGHLVMGTLHTNNAIRTINRILDAFPPKQQSQIRAMVSESLRAIVSQRLLPSADGQRRVVALEVLYVKPAVSNLIRDEKTFQIRSLMQVGRADGMCLLDDSLAELVKTGQITKETARRAAEDPKRFGEPKGAPPHAAP